MSALPSQYLSKAAFMGLSVEHRLNADQSGVSRLHGVERAKESAPGVTICKPCPSQAMSCPAETFTPESQKKTRDAALFSALASRVLDLTLLQIPLRGESHSLLLPCARKTHLEKKTWLWQAGSGWGTVQS